MPETDRILGEHGARLTAIERGVADIALDVKTLLADKNQAEGSKKTFYAIAGAIGAFSGTAAAFASKLFK